MIMFFTKALPVFESGKEKEMNYVSTIHFLYKFYNLFIMNLAV